MKHEYLVNDTNVNIEHKFIENLIRNPDFRREKLVCFKVHVIEI